MIFNDRLTIIYNMATSLLTTGDGKDEVDGIFPRRRPSTFSYYEIEDSVANFDSATSKEDFALHYAVFQGDLNAVQKLITKDNKDSLDTHGKCSVCVVCSVYVCVHVCNVCRKALLLACKANARESP